MEQPIFPYKTSPYQEAIFNFVRHGVGNAVISARAGSGKTTTLIHMAKLIPSKEKCIFLAFNRSIAEELAEKLKDMPNVSVRTAHGLGLAMLQRNFDNVRINEFKYQTYVRGHIEELSSMPWSILRKEPFETYINTILSLIDFSRLNMAQSAREIFGIANKYGVIANLNECAAVQKCLEWGREHTEIVDFTDMIWLPVELGLVPRGLQYNWVFHDECQDASVVMFELIKKTFKRGTRYVAAGDPFQAIYAFAGADEEAFNNICSLPNTQVFDLPISYRCDTAIIELANEIVPDIVARDNAERGLIVRNCSLKSLRDGDMVLSRNRAPLVTLYSKLLDEGVKSYIKGMDVGENLIRVLNNITAEELNPSLEKDGVFAQLFLTLFTERDKLMDIRKTTKDEATLSPQITELYDTITILRLLSKNITTKKELVERIEKIFSDEEKEGVCLSTVHKAKGLESTNVYIVCESSMPSKMAKREWELIQERNLIYVAYTRAKQRLGFISERIIPPIGKSESPESILRKLNEYENQLMQVIAYEIRNNQNPITVVTEEDVSMQKAESKETTKPRNHQDNEDLLSDLEGLFVG